MTFKTLTGASRVLFIVAMITLEGRAQQKGPDLRKMSLEDLLNVEVTTVSRRESTVGQSPAAVFVITPEMIRRSGVTHLPELFRMVPGMAVARLDNNKWAVGVRGFNDRFQRFLLVQIDGRTLYNPIFSGVYWDTVDYPLEDIERIEVIRGPGASVWGANAVNGIINIITKSSQESQGGMINAGGGNEEGFGTVRHGGRISDALNYRVYGRGFNSSEQFASTGDSGDRWWSASGGLRLDWNRNERDAFTFDGSFGHTEAGRLDLRPTVAAPFVISNREDEITNAGHILARWSRLLDNGSRWSVQAYWDSTRRELPNVGSVLRWDIFDLDFQHEFALAESNKIVWGGGYRLIDASLENSARDNGFMLAWVPNDSHPQLFSAFVQDQITLAPDKLSVTFGSKFEHNDFSGFEVQPTGRLLWTPTRKQTVWGAVSRAVRTPALSDETIRITLPQSAPGVGPYPQVTGETSVDSEDVVAFEVGYREQATTRVSVDLALFYNEYGRLRIQRPGTDFTNAHGVTIRPLVRENSMVGETYGTELSTVWQPGERWRLHGAYTFLRMNLHAMGLPDAARTSTEAIEGQSPQHQFFLQSSLNLPGNVELDLTGRYVGRITGFNTGAPDPLVPNRITAYFSPGARLSFQPRDGLTLEVVGENLQDNRHPEFGTSSSIRSPVVELQRSVYGKVTWRF